MEPRGNVTWLITEQRQKTPGLTVIFFSVWFPIFNLHGNSCEAYWMALEIIDREVKGWEMGTSWPLWLKKWLTKLLQGTCNDQDNLNTDYTTEDTFLGTGVKEWKGPSPRSCQRKCLGEEYQRRHNLVFMAKMVLSEISRRASCTILLTFWLENFQMKTLKS